MQVFLEAVLKVIYHSIGCLDPSLSYRGFDSPIWVDPQRRQWWYAEVKHPGISSRTCNSPEGLL